MIVNGRHQVMNFFESIGVGIGFVASNAVRRSYRIEVNQSCTDSRPKSSTQEIFDVVVGGLSTDSVAVVFDQSIKDSIVIGRADLAKLPVGDEVRDDVIIPLVALNRDISELPASLAAHTSSQVGFEVGLHRISGLTLTLSDVYFRQFQVCECLNITRNGAAFVVVDLPKFFVAIDPSLNSILYDPLPPLQNPPPPVDPDVAALHDRVSCEAMPIVPRRGYRMGIETLDSQAGVHF